MPYFGEYQELRERKKAELYSSLPVKNGPLEKTRPAPEPVRPVPSVQEVIGKALPHITNYKKLDNKKQVVALIDDV